MAHPTPPLAHRLLAVALLACVLATFVFGQALLLRDTRMRDGRPGLSLNDVVLGFTGDATSLLEARAEDDMRPHLSEAELAELVVWARTGADAAAYERRIAGLLDDRCTGCHNPEGVAGFRPLDTLASAQAAALAPPAPGVSRQLLVTKVHLVGIGLLLAVPSWLAGRSRLPQLLVATLVAAAYGGLFMDFGSWWAMRIHTDAALGRALGHVTMSLGFVGLWCIAVGASVTGTALGRSE